MDDDNSKYLNVVKVSKSGLAAAYQIIPLDTYDLNTITAITDNNSVN